MLPVRRGKAALRWPTRSVRDSEPDVRRVLLASTLLFSCSGDPGAPVHADAGSDAARACPADVTLLEPAGAMLAGCGSVAPGTGCLGGQPPPSDADLAALACLRDALAACKPARLDYRQPAADVGPSQTFVVEPDGSGACGVVVLTDDGASPVRTVTRQTCSGVTVDTHCLGVWGADCGGTTTACSGS